MPLELDVVANANTLFPGTTAMVCADEVDWLDARRNGLGASEVATIMGAGRRSSTPLGIWMHKTGRAEVEVTESEAMYWGKAQEPAIAGRYVRETGRQIIDLGPYTILRSAKYPWLSATLDRVIVEADGRVVPAPLELKTAHWLRRREFLEEPPAEYQMQCQTQMVVTGAAWVGLAVVIGNEAFECLDLDRHEPFIEHMLEVTDEWWRRHVLGDTPPEATGQDQDRKALDALYPETGGMVELPAEAQGWDEELLDLKARLKQYEERAKFLENLFRAAIGEATIGLVPDTRITYTLKTTTRTTPPRLEPLVTTFRQLRRQEGKA